jgi:hypothetical protein
MDRNWVESEVNDVIGDEVCLSREMIHCFVKAPHCFLPELMVRIFLIVSIVLSIGSAAIAFLTKSGLRDLQNKQDTLVQQAKATVVDLGKTTEALERTKEELTTSTKLVEDRQTEIGGLNRQLAASKEDASKAKQDKAEAEKKFADAEATVEKAKKEIEKVEGLEKELADLKASSVDAVAAKDRELERIKGELATAQKKQDGGRSVRASSGAGEMELVGGGGMGMKAERKVESRPAPKSGTVVSFDPAWNFAVISIGDRSGVTPETVLYAMRGNTTIARLKVSKVYADQAVVLPEDLSPPKSQEKEKQRDSDKALIRLNLFNERSKSSVANGVRAGDRVVIASGQEKKDERAAAVAEAKSAAVSPVPAVAPAKKADAADPLLAIPGLPGLPGDDKPAEKPAPADSKDAVPDPFKLNFN